VAIPIPYVTEIEARYGEVVPVSSLVRRVMANNPGPFTYLGTGTYLIGHGDIAVVDAGPDDAAHVEAVLAALEPGERVTHLVVTHTHSDHSPASGPLQERTGAATYGFGAQLRVPDLAALADDAVVFGDPEADADPTADAGQADDGAPKPPPRPGDPSFCPDVLLRDGDVVEGDGWTLEAVHTPGHASNHLCYLLREEGVLCSGDHVMGWSTTVVSPPDGNLGDYVASLEKLLERPQDRSYLPTHGPAIEEPHTLVRAYLAHRRRRSEEILAALDTGPATIAEIVPRIYADTDKKMWRAAAGSVYAHLLHLRDLGDVEAQDDPPRRRSTWTRRRP
jgi:glyoxylase-like metal-dependent hydrolase (beta-lactamase superfamily II)